MPTYWCNRRIPAKLLPLKVQAQRIKNNGKDPIYLFSIDDDMPVAMGMMLAFSVAVINPGQEMDIVNNPFFNAISPWSDPDQDVCIHADGDIEVDIISSDACDRWQSNPNHPWNGAPYPNGQHTKRFQAGHAVIGGGGGGSFPPGIPAGVPIGVGNLGQPMVPGFGHLPKRGVDFIEVNITIQDCPKCTCGEQGNRHPGRCSYWCDLELNKNKETL